MNVCEHLTNSARIFPNRTAIRFEGLSISYSELDQRCAHAAAAVKAADIRSGDRVAIALGNVPAFAVWYFAALRVGAIAVSVSTRSAPSEIAYFAEDCEARLFVSNRETVDAVAATLPSCVEHQIVTNDRGDEWNAPTSNPPAETPGVLQMAPHDPATILYTSGTTGFAKGATLSHMNVRSNVCAFNHLCNMRADDRILLAVPLFHCFGQNALLNSALNAGATLVLQRKFDLNESKRLIQDERVTQLYGVPMMFHLFLNSCTEADLASVSYCFSAAAPLPSATEEQWHQKFGLPISQGYGLTETSPFASYNHRDRHVAGSIGTPIDCAEMKISDTETGEECADGELGEIAIRGPNVMLGYWNRDEQTREAIRDGWFHSGDIGRRDEEGFFYIVDRVKDMISVGGLKVFPAEVERVLLDHPDVEEVAVVGRTDAVFGEQVTAYVVLSADASAPDAIASLAAHAKSTLANYKVPRAIFSIEELPRNPSGKILKRTLRELPAPDLSADLSRSDKSESSQTVTLGDSEIDPSPVAMLSQQLQRAHVASRQAVATTYLQEFVQTAANLDEAPLPTSNFLDAGLDSLMIVELTNQLQAEVGPEHELPATLIFDYPRIVDLAEYLVATLLDDGATVADSAPQQPKPDPLPQNLRTEVESLSEEEALAELMKELE